MTPIPINFCLFNSVRDVLFYLPLIFLSPRKQTKTTDVHASVKLCEYFIEQVVVHVLSIYITPALLFCWMTSHLFSESWIISFLWVDADVGTPPVPEVAANASPQRPRRLRKPLHHGSLCSPINGGDEGPVELAPFSTPGHRLIWLLMVQAASGACRLDGTLTRRLGWQRWPHTSHSKVKHAITGASTNPATASWADGLWCFLHD